MKINTKEEFVNYAMKKFEEVDDRKYYLFPIELFEQIAADIAYTLGENLTQKQVLDILCDGEYNPKDVNTSASLVSFQPSEEEILKKRICLAEKLWEFRVIL
jgi:hypothetical protein